jgi:hypothetical protein
MKQERYSKQHSRIAGILARARATKRVLTAREMEEVRKEDPELYNDYQGTIDAVMTTHLKVLRIRSEFFPRSPQGLAVHELVRHRAFIAACVRALCGLGFSKEESTRVEGIGKFRALIGFVNRLTTDTELRFAVQEAVESENLIGPLSRESTYVAKGLVPLLFVAGECYTPYDPEKSAIRALMQAFYNARNRIGVQPSIDAMHLLLAARTSSKNLVDCFRGGANGIIGFFVPWKHRERTVDTYIELAFWEEMLYVVDATGEFVPEIDSVYNRKRIPDALKTAILRKIGSTRRKVPGNVFPLVSKSA